MFHIVCKVESGKFRDPVLLWLFKPLTLHSQVDKGKSTNAPQSLVSPQAQEKLHLCPHLILPLPFSLNLTDLAQPVSL